MEQNRKRMQERWRERGEDKTNESNEGRTHGNIRKRYMEREINKERKRART